MAEGPNRCRFLWSRDVLPHDAAGALRAAMERAAPIIKGALEGRTGG
ncbi:hypothetical protein JYB55_04850 [Mycolicibacterium septicum]|nr:hypothetical protein [Mycolicibacterium septicum]